MKHKYSRNGSAAAKLELPLDHDAATRGVNDAPMPDRRGQKRTTVVWRGWAVVGKAKHECVVMNVSRGGAKLRFLNPLIMPQEFALAIDGAGVFPVTTRKRDARSGHVKFKDNALDTERMLKLLEARLRHTN